MIWREKASTVANSGNVLLQKPSSWNTYNATVKFFFPQPPGQPQGQRKNECDKMDGALENEVKKEQGTRKWRD